MRDFVFFLKVESWKIFEKPSLLKKQHLNNSRRNLNFVCTFLVQNATPSVDRPIWENELLPSEAKRRNLQVLYKNSPDMPRLQTKLNHNSTFKFNVFFLWKWQFSAKKNHHMGRSTDRVCLNCKRNSVTTTPLTSTFFLWKWYLWTKKNHHMG